MGLGYGLVQGLSRGLAGYQRGQIQGQEAAQNAAERAQAQQAALLHQMLAERLMNAQIGEYGAQQAERVRGTQAATAQAQAVAQAAQQLRALPDLDPRLKALPDAQLVEAVKTQAVQPPRNIDPNSPQGIAAQERLINARSGAALSLARQKQKEGLGGGFGSGLQVQKARYGAAAAARSLEQALRLVDPSQGGNPTNLRMPVLAGIGRSAAESGLANYVPGLRGAGTAIEQSQLSTQQQQVQSLIDQATHNAIGNLPGSRQSLTLFNNLRSTIAAPPGSAPQTLQQRISYMRDLVKRWKAFAQGQDVDLSDVPGFDALNFNDQSRYSSDNPFADEQP